MLKFHFSPNWCIPVIIPTNFFVEFNKQILKYIWKCSQNIQSNLEKKQSWRTILPDFIAYYKVTIIKTMWYAIKSTNRSMERIKSAEIDPHIWDHFIFYKGAKAKHKMDLELIPLWGKMTKNLYKDAIGCLQSCINCLVNSGPFINIIFYFWGKFDIGNEIGFMLNKKWAEMTTWMIRQ